MLRFSANLGFLFKSLTLIEAVAAAADAGFSAVEFHRPYDTTATGILKTACDRAGLSIVSLNTVLGDRAAGERGLAALPGREDDARRDIDRALRYAAAIGARGVNVLAGINGVAAVYEANLRYALESARLLGISIFIEPQNTRDHPGYFLTSMDTAMRIQDRIGANHLKILFDCYHVWAGGNDVSSVARANMDRIGHIQIAGVPDRGEPDRGEIDYRRLLPALREAGYDAAFGAEYRPRSGDTRTGLGWLQALTST